MTETASVTVNAAEKHPGTDAFQEGIQEYYG